MTVLLGGRAAEHVVYARYSTGAADDLVKVTNIARSMVTRYAMDEKLGHLSFEEERAPFLATPGAMVERNYSEDTARAIDRAARDFANAAFERAVAILTHNRELLERGARELLQKETLDEREIEAIAQTIARPPYRT
jgi:cell division protease FtsH